MDEKNKMEELIRNITLGVLNTGTQYVNYEIIRLLPDDVNLPIRVNHIMEETGLTKVPVNKHINDLQKHGLLKREKGTGNVYPTELTRLLKLLIEKLEIHVKANVSNMLPNMLK